MMQFTVAVSEERLVLLDLVADMAARQERAWLDEQRAEHRGLRATRLAEARRATRERMAALRESGELAGSRDWLLVPQVWAELEERGWNRRHRPVPPGSVAAGRRWGTDPGRYSDQHDPGESRFLGRLGLRLPVDLGETLQRAVYWHNAKIERQLQEWSEKWGDGPEVIMRQSERVHGGITPIAFMGAGLAPIPDKSELAVRTKLRQQIVTTGDIVRAALDRALAEAPKRARAEHRRLTLAQRRALAEAAFAEERKAEAEHQRDQALAEHKNETAEKLQIQAASHSNRATISRLEAAHHAAEAESVAGLLELLADHARPDRGRQDEQLALDVD